MNVTVDASEIAIRRVRFKRRIDENKTLGDQEEVIFDIRLYLSRRDPDSKSSQEGSGYHAAACLVYNGFHGFTTAYYGYDEIQALGLALFDVDKFLAQLVVGGCDVWIDDRIYNPEKVSIFFCPTLDSSRRMIMQNLESSKKATDSN
jgi:hypothetical protein